MEAASVRRQRVHTRARTTWLPTRTLPTCRLGRKRRLVRTLEWLTLCPYCGPLPQISHLLAMVKRPVEAAEVDCTIGSAMASTEQQTQHSTLRRTHQWGRIDVFPSAVAAVAGHAAAGCYGVMGMAARGLRDGVALLL